MTILAAATDDNATPTLLWTSPDTNLWVASSHGNFAGWVEFTDGHFVVSDSTGIVVLTTSNIPAAQRALTAHALPGSHSRADQHFEGAATSTLRHLLDRRPRTAYRRGAVRAA